MPVAPRARLVGFGLVAIPLPTALVLHLTLLHTGRLDEALFVGGLVAFAIGAVLVLGRDDRRDDGRPQDDPEPHWWPDFEREFRAHVRSLQRDRRKLVRL